MSNDTKQPSICPRCLQEVTAPFHTCVAISDATKSQQPSKTPETDALDANLQKDITLMLSQGVKLSAVTAHVVGGYDKYARTLEQQRDEARRELSEMTNIAEKCRTRELEQLQELTTLREKLAEATKDRSKGWIDLIEERDQLTQQIAELKKDKERLDWLDKQNTLAIWQGTFSDSEYNIRLQRAGAPIVTLSSMDDDGHEVDEEIAGGDSLRTAIDAAMQKNQ